MRLEIGGAVPPGDSASGTSGLPRTAPTEGRGVYCAEARPPERRPTQAHNARARDEDRFRPETLPSAAYLRHAALESGRNPASLAFDFLKLHRGRGKLTLPEYVQYGVYDPALSEDERRRFVGESLHWPITRHCCDFTWQATTEDKWLCARILERFGVCVPPTLAVIDTGSRPWPDTRTIRSPAELRDVVVAHTGGDDALFGKVNRGVASFGAFLVLEGDGDRLHVHGEGCMDYRTFLERIVGDSACLLQRREHNHPSFARWTEHLATVRVYLMLSKEGDARVPFTVLKLPSSDNVADNFWRAGNLACELCPDTGTILKARTMDAFGTTDHATHPVTGTPLVGETLPFWDQIIALARTCAPIFSPIRYQSLDIAITPTGPILIPEARPDARSTPAARSPCRNWQPAAASSPTRCASTSCAAGCADFERNGAIPEARPDAPPRAGQIVIRPPAHVKQEVALRGLVARQRLAHRSHRLAQIECCGPGRAPVVEHDGQHRGQLAAGSQVATANQVLVQQSDIGQQAQRHVAFHGGLELEQHQEVEPPVAQSHPPQGVAPAPAQVPAHELRGQLLEGAEVERVAPPSGGEPAQQVLDHPRVGEQELVGGVVHRRRVAPRDPRHGRRRTRRRVADGRASRAPGR